MTRLSVMAYSFAGALRQGAIDHTGIARFCRDAGVLGIELMDSLLQGDDPDAVLGAHGLECCCYDVSARLAAKGADDAPALRDALMRAARWGAARVLVVPGEPPPGLSAEAARSRIIEGLRACAADASRLGITLTLEHRGGALAEVYGSTSNLMAVGEGVGGGMAATCDAGNCVLAGERPDEAVRRLAPRLAHVHLKDWSPLPEGSSGGLVARDGSRYLAAALGEGVVDLEGTARALRAVGYAGWVSVEYEGREDPLAAVARGVHHARALFGPDR